jgi:hypothetical protein
MDKQPEGARKTKFWSSFRGKAVLQPPGTKTRGRLPRGLEDEVSSPRRLWFAVAVLAALAVGVVIGSWLLP